MRKLTKKHIIQPTLLSLLLMIGIYGCGSVPDGDFSPFTSSGYHPFAEDEKGLENHAQYLKANNGSFSECTACHGENLRGVDNGVVETDGEKDRSCYRCHNSNNHFTFNGSHTTYMQENNWDMQSCYLCHNNSESDQELAMGKSCSNSDCHNQSPAGPQECNTCHGTKVGDYTYPANWAPPADLMGSRFNTEHGVGMHQSHVRMTSGNFGVYACNVCHLMPTSWDSPRHISDNTLYRAEVVFGLPATRRGAEPVYNQDNMTCSSTYCHWGKTAEWTQVGGWTECGSCHGMPPERPHFQDLGREDCYRCHGSVIDTEGTIINPRLHANGSRNMN